MMNYFLLHKNDICGAMTLDKTTGRIKSYKDNGLGLSPYLGSASLSRIQNWWEMRAVPDSRSTVQAMILHEGFSNSRLYLARNLGLSITDSYWICPVDASLTYEQVRFHRSEPDDSLKSPDSRTGCYDYNASLGGQMEKYWDLDHPVPVLVKESSKYYGQQSVNEMIATRIHELQQTDIPFVKYTAETVPGHGTACYCSAFTSENVELISAYELVESQKRRNHVSLYDHYIEVCVQNGIDRTVMQNFMDYQTMTDFVISNTDEHLTNLGVLRDTNTMKLIGPAPIYDSGNSMFYDSEIFIPHTRTGLLSCPISSFYKTEDQMLSKVHDRSILKIDLLPSSNEIKDWYLQAGIPEEKAVFISKNYETKLELVKEFQHGKTISLYHEKNSKTSV